MALTRVDLGDADGGIDGLVHEGAGDRGDGSLGCTVDGSVAVSLLTGDRANVDDMALVSATHSWDNGLGDID